MRVRTAPAPISVQAANVLRRARKLPVGLQEINYESWPEACFTFTNLATAPIFKSLKRRLGTEGLGWSESAKALPRDLRRGRVRRGYLRLSLDVTLSLGRYFDRLTYALT
jgi:hypothetical protein